MTPNEFKVKFPEHSDLEGDELWDAMTLVMMLQSDVLTADPDREVVYLEPVILANGMSLSIEDDSTTRWLNSKGEEVKLKPERSIRSIEKAIESYRMAIIDMSKL